MFPERLLGAMQCARPQTVLCNLVLMLMELTLCVGIQQILIQAHEATAVDRSHSSLGATALLWGDGC